MQAHLRIRFCSDCGNVFKNRRSLLCHVKEKHSGVDASIHLCPLCGRKFPRKTSLDVHLDFVHYGKMTVCLYCDETFASRSSKNRHILKVHGKNRENEIGTEVAKDFDEGQKSIRTSETETKDVGQILFLSLFHLV